MPRSWTRKRAKRNRSDRDGVSPAEASAYLNRESCLAMGHKPTVQRVQEYGTNLVAEITHCHLCCWMESKYVLDQP